MDIGTILGLLAAAALIGGAISIGSSLLVFVNIPSLLIVAGGTLCGLFVAFPLARTKESLKVAKNAFLTRPRQAEAILELMRNLSMKARREGVLALEEVARSHDDDFVRRGLQMVVDGQPPETIEEVLYGEIDKTAERHAAGAEYFDTMGFLAPAFGMLGTLIGLVQMLQSLDDPTTIGPAMAVALLTTFYGSVVANVFAIPVAKKLRVRSQAEIQEKTLVAEGLLSIVAGENPRFLADRLNAQLPPAERLREAV